jgi:hypothetical protein
MDEITERDIVEAAKAAHDRTFMRGCWEMLSFHAKWRWLEMAYAALRAARKARLISANSTIED